MANVGFFLKDVCMFALLLFKTIFFSVNIHTSTSAIVWQCIIHINNHDQNKIKQLIYGLYTLGIINYRLIKTLQTVIST